MVFLAIKERKNKSIKCAMRKAKVVRERPEPYDFFTLPNLNYSCFYIAKVNYKCAMLKILERTYQTFH